MKTLAAKIAVVVLMIAAAITAALFPFGSANRSSVEEGGGYNAGLKEEDFDQFRGDFRGEGQTQNEKYGLGTVIELPNDQEIASDSEYNHPVPMPTTQWHAVDVPIKKKTAKPTSVSLSKSNKKRPFGGLFANLFKKKEVRGSR